MNDRISIVWLLLAALTGLSWLLAEGLIPEHDGNSSYQAVSLLAVAFFKARLVIIYFMEVGDAPWVLRGALESWVFVVFSAMVTLYLFGAPA